MNKGAILSLLVAGLITGSYIEFQVNQSGDVVDTIEVGVAELPFEAVEPSLPVVGNFQVEAPATGSTVLRFLRVEPVGTSVFLESSVGQARYIVTRDTELGFEDGRFEGTFVAPDYLGKITIAFDVYRDGKRSGSTVVEGYASRFYLTPGWFGLRSIF